MPNQPSNSLLGLSLPELTNLALESGQPGYRGRQLFDAVYRQKQKIERLDQISTLPLEYRARLAEQGWEVGLPEIARKFISTDGTMRYLVELSDGETVETVWMPEGDGGETGNGSEAGNEDENEVEGGEATASSASGHDLRVEPGGMRGELQVLLHGAAWGSSGIWRREKSSGRSRPCFASGESSLRYSGSTSCSWAWASLF